MWKRVKRGIITFELSHFHAGWFVSMDQIGRGMHLLNPQRDIFWATSCIPKCFVLQDLNITYKIEAINCGYYPSGWHGLSLLEESGYLKALWLHAARRKLEEYEELVAWKLKHERSERAKKNWQKRWKNNQAA